MFAHLRATVLLVTIAGLTAAADSSSLVRADLVSVYLDSGTNADSAALVYMRRETESLMRSAGFYVDWRDTNATRQPELASNLVVLRLNGSCAPASGQVQMESPASGPVQLASAPEIDGRVLPYAQVDCPALTTMLAGFLNSEPAARRTYLYGRAMGRLAAHELYHVLGQTMEHSRNGVSKPCFTLGDLTAEVFEFEPEAVARLRRISNSISVADGQSSPAALPIGR